MRKILFYCSLFYYYLTFGQSIPLPINVQAPTTASLGKYGDVPVNLYNGTTNVNIPLISLNEKDIEMDISLSYDTSGIIVNNVPTWVGQNWSLNAGGVITRQVNGFPDEYNTLSDPSVLNKAVGFINPISRNRLNVSNWNDPYTLLSIEQSNWGNNNYPDAYIGKDSEPDIFSFNFMGHSGKFFMGEDGQWRVASDENFKVVISESDFFYPFNSANDPYGNYLSKVIGKIVLIDDQGNRYTFGENSGSNTANTSIEYSKDFFRQSNVGSYPDKWKANAWYLTKVQNNQGIVLYTLEYVRENGYTAIFYNYQFTESFATHFNGSTNSNCSSSGTGSGIYGDGGPAIGGQLISPVYLSKIRTYSKVDLTFESSYSQSTYYESSTIKDVSTYINNYLNNVVIDPVDASNFFYNLKPYSNGSEIVNKLKFRKLTAIYGYRGGVYFNYNEPTSIQQHNYRFNLNNVQVSGKTYQFEYDRFDQLPKLTSKAIDHLGYFRGTEYISNYYDPINHFNQRSTNSDKVLIGSLKKIIYPTKGYTQFEYEPHQYSKYVSDDKQSLISVNNSIIGGLRIKKIISNNLNGTQTIKEYKYVKDYNQNHNNTTSSGILSCLPKYYWSDWQIKSAPGSPNGYLSESHFSINPLISMSNFFGASIGYSEIVELNEDQSYTIFKYTSNENYRDEPFVTTFNINPSPYQKCNDKSMLRGKLLETSVYNSTNVMVLKNSNYYPVEITNELTKFIKGSNIISKACFNSPGYGFLMGNAYKIYYFDFQKIKDQEISYLNGQQIKKQKNYTYTEYPNSINVPYDLFLKSIISETYLDFGQYDSKNIQEIYTYPFEINSAINNSLVSNRVFNSIQKDILKNGSLLYTEKLEYDYMPPYYNLLPKKILRSKENNGLEEDKIIDSYDSAGNIRQFHYNNGLYTTLSWSYEKSYIIAKIVSEQPIDPTFLNTKEYEIQQLLSTSAPPESSDINPILSKLNEIRNYYSNCFVTTYTHYPRRGVITSITDSKGDTTFYSSDSNGQLINVKDKNGNILSENQYHYRP